MLLLRSAPDPCMAKKNIHTVIHTHTPHTHINTKHIHTYKYICMHVNTEKSINTKNTYTYIYTYTYIFTYIGL